METTAAAQGGANMMLFLFLLAMVVLMLWSGRGQKKREQERQTKVDALQKGDGVILSGGIVGTVAGFKDNMLEIKIAENVKLTVLKTAVVGFVNEMQPVKQQGDAK